MPETKEIGSIRVITDDDTGMYHIGEVDGGWNGLVKEHIEDHGVDGLLVHLAYMVTRVIEINRETNRPKDEGSDMAKSPVSTKPVHHFWPD